MIAVKDFDSLVKKFGKKRLVLQTQGTGLALLLFDRSGILKYESLLLHESSEETLAFKVRNFLGSARPAETLLIMARSEVLQRELALPSAENLREGLESTLAKLLPYSPREMAYGLAALDSNGSPRALLYAVPEKQVRETLGFFERLGIRVDEIVSEDQCLWWLIEERIQSEPVLVIDGTRERFLFSLVRQSGVLFSRQYPRVGESLENIISEISIPLLESGQKVSRVICSGVQDAEKEEIVRLLKAPMEAFHPEGGRLDVPAAMLGAMRWGRYPLVSLLPHDLKIQRKRISRRKLLIDSFKAFGLFVASFSLLSASHLLVLKHRDASLEKEINVLTAQVAEIKAIASSLGKMRDSEYSKERLLNLIHELANGVPGSIRLRSLEVGEKEIVVEAEGPTHAVLTETVQAFEKSQFLKDVKLEHTRLRKRLNQDFFEFEITARWKA